MGCFSDPARAFFDPATGACVDELSCEYADETTRACRRLGETGCARFSKKQVLEKEVKVCADVCPAHQFESGRECVDACLAPLVGDAGQTCVPAGAAACPGFFDAARGACASSCERLDRAAWTCESGASCEVVAEDW